MKLSFHKMNSNGNDFVILDAVRNKIHLTESQVMRICDRVLGIGCDQLLLIEVPEQESTDFSMKIWNQDGGKAKNCINGLCCSVKWAIDSGLVNNKKLNVAVGWSELGLSNVNAQLEKAESAASKISSRVSCKVPLAAMKVIENVSYCSDELLLKYAIDKVNQVTVGNDHLVFWTQDTSVQKLEQLVSELSEQVIEQFNVSLCQQHESDQVKLYTYERGTGITESCGSAAVASLLSSKIKVKATLTAKGGAFQLENTGEYIRFCTLARVNFQGTYSL